MIGNKVKHALEVGLKVILCVGEQLSEREAGNTMKVVISQLESAVPGITDWNNVVIVCNELLNILMLFRKDFNFNYLNDVIGL